MADGPTSSSEKSSATPASLAAIFVSVFFTTANVASLPSAWRSALNCATVSPRYSVRTAPDELWNRSVSSATVASFTALAMGILPPLGAGSGTGRSERHHQDRRVARKRRTPRAQAHRGGTTAGDRSHGARYSSVHLRGPPGHPGPSAAARERTAAADGLWRDQEYAPAPSRPNRAASSPPGRASAVLA